jgi:hypothetical protein
VLLLLTTRILSRAWHNFTLNIRSSAAALIERMTNKQVQPVAKPRPKPPAAGMGRKKGSLNKTTALLKDAILKAAQEAGGGGPDGIVNYLTLQASENPGPFMTLIGKVLPFQVAGDPNQPIVHKVIREIVRAKDTNG